MRRRLACILLFFFTFWVFPTEAFSQNDQLSGRVLAPNGQSIPSATVKLISSLADSQYQPVAISDSNGNFSIQFDWKKVKEENKAGATWKVSAEKDDYLANEVNVLLSSGNIQPKILKIVLKPVGYEKEFAKVDRCGNQGTDGHTLYLFELKADTLGPGELKTFLHILTHKLDSGIRTHMESYGLMGQSKLKVAACTGFPVDVDQAAITFGQRLRSPGVMWGYVQKDPNRINSIVTFTLLVEAPLTGLSTVSYEKDIFKLMQEDKPVGKPYLAFAAFILGKLHWKENNFSHALKCFNHAKNLKALPQAFHDDLNLSITEVRRRLPVETLAPVGGGS